MLKRTWEMDGEERIALAEHRCEFLFRHINESGGAPRRTRSPTTIIVPSKERVFSVSISKKDPRHVTVSLSFTGPPVEEQQAVYAAQSASQSTIVSKVRIAPRQSEFRFSVESSYFNDDEDDLAQTLGLYIAAVHDTYEHFMDELTKSA